MAPKIVDQQRESDTPRAPVPAPYIPISVLRKKLGLTLTAVCDRIYAETGIRTERGTISAIETGQRGASIELIKAMAEVYDIDVDLIDTAYTPRHRQGSTT